jgi:putative sterol carrier protein
MATKDVILNIFIQMKEKISNPQYKSHFEDFTKKLQFTFPDINTSHILIISNGNIEFLPEQSIDTPDIHVIVNSNDFLDITNKKIDPITAYTSGKMKAKGKFSDLIKLQELISILQKL